MIRLSMSTMGAVLSFTFPVLSSAQGTSRATSASTVPDSAHLVARLATLADSLERANALSGVIHLARKGTPV